MRTENGGRLMWGMWPVGASAGWWDLRLPSPSAAGEQHERRADARCDRVLAASGHPTFTSASAAQWVRGLSWSELTTLWRRSGGVLAASADPRRRWAQVTLRAAVLDEMEASYPAAFGPWCERARRTSPLRGPGRGGPLSWRRRTTEPPGDGR